MMNYLKIVEKYSENASEKQMQELTELTNEYIEEPYNKNEFLEDVEAIFSKHLSMRKAKEKISEMINDDGSRGEHWSPEQVSIVWKNAGHSTDTDKYTPAEVYYIMNMVYSDYYKMYKDNIASYLMHTYLFLNDKDFDDEKVSKAKWYACDRY